MYVYDGKTTKILIFFTNLIFFHSPVLFMCPIQIFWLLKFFCPSCRVRVPKVHNLEMAGHRWMVVCLGDFLVVVKQCFLNWLRLVIRGDILEVSLLTHHYLGTSPALGLGLIRSYSTNSEATQAAFKYHSHPHYPSTRWLAAQASRSVTLQSIFSISSRFIAWLEFLLPKIN